MVHKNIYDYILDIVAILPRKRRFQNGSGTIACPCCILWVSAGERIPRDFFLQDDNRCPRCFVIWIDSALFLIIP